MMHKISDKKQQGFTLVEISVVLVIVGLLAASILVGSSIMKSAELQKVAADLTKFRDAAKQFHDKYKYFPGDFPEAGEFWVQPEPDLGSPTPAAHNGNGDGVVGGYEGTPVQFGTEYREPIYFWEHLTNAGFLEGTYTGRAAASGIDWWNPGTNMPEGMDKNAGYTFSYASPGTVSYNIIYPELGSIDITTYEMNYGHVLVYGNPRNIGHRRTASGGALTGVEALALDEKIDDGKPGLGNLVAIPKTSDGITYLCVDSTNASSAVYLIASDARHCSVVFVTGL